MRTHRRITITKSALFIFLVVISFTFNKVANASQTNGEILWFLNLIKANNGNTFCAPRGTRISELAGAVSKYASEHPQLHGRLTTHQTIQALAERYPCKPNSNANLGHRDIRKLAGRSISVTATGVFSSINTKPTIALIEKLRSTQGHENDYLIAQIEHHSGNYTPPTLFALANLLYRQGDIDNAIFWFNAARLRGFYDARLCTDASTHSAIAILEQRTPHALIKKQYEDIPRLRKTLTRVLHWDATTPYHYDHRWIALHGMRAIRNGLSQSRSNAPLTVPRNTWAALAQDNRNKFRTEMNQIIAVIEERKETH